MSNCVNCGKIFRKTERKRPAVGNMVAYLRKMGKMEDNEMFGNVCEKCRHRITSEITNTFFEEQKKQPVALNKDEQLQLQRSIPRGLMFRDIHGTSLTSKNV